VKTYLLLYRHTHYLDVSHIHLLPAGLFRTFFQQYQLQNIAYYTFFRLNGVQTISREVPYSRLIDASPTPVLKMDSRPPSPHRFNTTRSILSVPENTLAVDNGACPKYSVSDSRLAVDYFNTTALQYNALVTSAQNNSVRIFIRPKWLARVTGIFKIPNWVLFFYFVFRLVQPMLIPYIPCTRPVQNIRIHELYL